MAHLVNKYECKSPQYGFVGYINLTFNSLLKLTFFERHILLENPVVLAYKVINYTILVNFKIGRTISYLFHRFFLIFPQVFCPQTKKPFFPL